MVRKVMIMVGIVCLITHISQPKLIKSEPISIEKKVNVGGKIVGNNVIEVPKMAKRIAKKEKPFEVKTIPMGDDLQRFLYKECKDNGIDYRLVLAVIKVESNYNSDRVSRTGDYGLLQINIVNHGELKKRLHINDFLNPYDSIRAGVYMLSNLGERYGDIDEVLMAYNLGEQGMKMAVRNGNYSSKYSRKIRAIYNEYLRGNFEEELISYGN